MSFSVTILGSSGMFATRERACAGYLLDVGDKIWVDAGSGTWRNLLDHVSYQELDGIILTQRHPDHTTDVLQAYHARQYGQAQSLPVIPLWAPQETLDALSSFSKELDNAFELRAVSGGDSVELGNATIRFIEMAHPGETFGVRVEMDGGVLAYSSDTGDGADFESLARGADVFICEATSQDSDELWEGHMRASQTGAVAHRLGVKRLILTHLRPGRDHQRTLNEAKAAAPDIAIELASDGTRLEVGR
ncbi:MAG TPA: MBL fold metallo-hydrolase [Actinomycetota bacterium]|nr:MBL fold metallo-hydrolase [Actinomycetota bacterium]